MLKSTSGNRLAIIAATPLTGKTSSNDATAACSQCGEIDLVDRPMRVHKSQYAERFETASRPVLIFVLRDSPRAQSAIALYGTGRGIILPVADGRKSTSSATYLPARETDGFFLWLR